MFIRRVAKTYNVVFAKQLLCCFEWLQEHRYAVAMGVCYDVSWWLWIARAFQAVARVF